MTEEVIVGIKGLQNTAEEEAEPIELISYGTYRYEDGKHMVQYEEVDEEDQEITYVTVIANGEHVEILKQGMSNVQMLFEKDQKTTSCYQTPYGELMVGIDTTSIHLEQEPDCICVNLKYALDMNYNHIADCDIEITISSKNNGK